MLITKEEFFECIAGFGVTSCTVRDRNIYYFTATDLNSNADPVIEQTAIDKRVLVFFLNKKEGDRMDYAQLGGIKRLFAGAPILPKNQFVGVDAGGEVDILGKGDDGFESKINSSPTGPKRGGVSRTKTIGRHLYVVCLLYTSPSPRDA